MKTEGPFAVAKWSIFWCATIPGGLMCPDLLPCRQVVGKLIYPPHKEKGVFFSSHPHFSLQGATTAWPGKVWRGKRWLRGTSQEHVCLLSYFCATFVWDHDGLQNPLAKWKKIEVAIKMVKNCQEEFVRKDCNPTSRKPQASLVLLNLGPTRRDTNNLAVRPLHLYTETCNGRKASREPIHLMMSRQLFRWIEAGDMARIRRDLDEITGKAIHLPKCPLVAKHTASGGSKKFVQHKGSLLKTSVTASTLDHNEKIGAYCSNK